MSMLPRLSRALSTLALCVLPAVCWPGEPKYLIDAHSQVDDSVDLASVIAAMDKAGVRMTILSTFGPGPTWDMLQWAQAYPLRIVPAVRMKMRTFRDNDSAFYKSLDSQVRNEGFAAMSEVLLFHEAQPRAPEFAVLPSAPQVEAALEHAIRRGWPFIVHIEFSSPLIPDATRYLRELEAMLAAHPGHSFLLAHMGQLPVSKVKDLIDKHPNVHFLTSRTAPTAVRRLPKNWQGMFAGETLAPEWKQLIEAHPDRFVLAFDNLDRERWGSFYQDQVREWKRAFQDLPDSVASAVAYGNAERLWHLVHFGADAPQ